MEVEKALMFNVHLYPLYLFPFWKNSLDTLRHSHWALFCESRRTYSVLVDTTFTLCFVRPHDIFKFKCTALVVRSSTCVLFIHLRLFWEPTPSFTLRRHFALFASVLSRRVALRSVLGTHYIYIYIYIYIYLYVAVGIARRRNIKALIKYRPAAFFSFKKLVSIRSSRCFVWVAYWIPTRDAGIW